MKKIILLLFLIGNAVCTAKDLKMKIEPSDTLRVVKKVSKHYVDGKLEEEETLSFFYENNLISKIETISDGKITGKVEIKYENGKIIEMKDYMKPSKSVNELSVLRVYNYDKDLIVSVSEIENEKQRLKMYSYNDLKQIVKCQTVEVGKVVSEETYLYNKRGNISERKYKGPSSNYRTLYKLYDDKHNSFGLLYSEAYLKIVSIGKNNILYSYGNDGEIEKFEYEYNSENYPTKITMRRNNQIKSITAIEYN